jgi:hypothetical protein
MNELLDPMLQAAGGIERWKKVQLGRRADIFLQQSETIVVG